MIALRANRTPTLAVVAQAAAVERAAARRQASPARRWTRRGMVFVAVLFGALAFLGGAGATPAQAWPWDDVKNLPGIIINFCGPDDVPELSTYAGLDNGFGLNTPDDNDQAKAYAEARKTVMPEEIPMDGSGYERLRETYPGGGDNELVIHPTYDRYGFSALRWTNFQQGCMSKGFLAAAPTNFVFDVLVKVPTLLTMAGVQLALDNTLYDIFSVLILPFVAVFAAIFRPWVVIFAILIGLPLVWAKTRGSVSKMLSAALWIAFIMGTFLWVTNNTSTVESTANNFVTSFTSEAACQLMEAGVQGSAGTCTGDGGSAGLNNALWRGIPYNTWMLGEVGDDQADRDRAAEADGRIGWSQAILNGLYVGTKADGTPDEKGDDVLTDAEAWNNATYGKNGDDTKTNLWTKEDQWKKVPFLTVVKFMCNDDEPANGKDGNGDGEHNRWSRSSCEAGKAGTASWIGNFRGEHYDQRLVAAFTGGIAAGAVFIALVFAALFVAYQKMQFFWILLWAPLWLAVGAIPQRREYAIKYAERAVAVIIYQCVGVLAVLFVANSLAILLFPPPGSNVVDIPWALKPIAAILYFITMITLYFPARKIGMAVTKNDTEIVRKTLDAPSDAAKWTIKTSVKAAVVAGVAAATGGTSLGAAALASGKVGDAAKLLDAFGGKTGKLVSSGLKLAEWRKSVGDLKGMADGRKRAEQAGAAALLKKDPAKYGLKPGQRPTKSAIAKAVDDFRNTAKAHERGSLADEEYNKTMQQQFAAHRRKHNGEYHPLDPANPANKDLDPGVLRAQMLRSMKDQALDVVNSPKWGNGEDLKAKLVLPSEQIKLNAGVATNPEAAQHLGGPNGILAQYNNNPGLMDPRHQATPALMKLMFTEANPDSEQFKQAFREAASAVVAYGVPNKVEGVWSVGQTAQDFSPMSVLGVMRQLNPADSPQQRLDDALVFSAAAASIPADHAAFAAVNEYRQALANPGVGAGEVNALGMNVVNAFTADNPQLIQSVMVDRELVERFEESGRLFAQQAGTKEGWAPVAGWAPSSTPPSDGRSDREPAPYSVPPRDPAPSYSSDSSYWSGFHQYEFTRDIAAAVAPLIAQGIQPSPELRVVLDRAAGDPFVLADEVSRLVRDELSAFNRSSPPASTSPPPAERQSSDERPDPGHDAGPFEGDAGDRGNFFPKWDEPR